MINHRSLKTAMLELLEPHKPARKRLTARRTGFTLIECVAMITIIGLLLSLSSVLMHRAFDVHHTALESFRQLEQINFWSERLRADASLAIQVATEADLLLTRANGEVIRYSIEQQRLVRSVLRDGQTVGQEGWNGWALSQVTWQIDSSGQLALLWGKLDFENSDQTREPLEWLARLPKYSRPND